MFSHRFLGTSGKSEFIGCSIYKCRFRFMACGKIWETTIASFFFIWINNVLLVKIEGPVYQLSSISC